MRIQLDLDEVGMKLLNELKAATGSKTHKRRLAWPSNLDKLFRQLSNNRSRLLPVL